MIAVNWNSSKVLLEPNEENWAIKLSDKLGGDLGFPLRNWIRPGMRGLFKYLGGRLLLLSRDRHRAYGAGRWHSFTNSSPKDDLCIYIWVSVVSICGSGGLTGTNRLPLPAAASWRFSARKGALCQFLLQKGRRQSWSRHQGRIWVILISDAWPHHPCPALPGSSLAVRHNLKLADVDRREQNGRLHIRKPAASESVLQERSFWTDFQVQILSHQLKFCFDWIALNYVLVIATVSGKLFPYLQ